MPAVAVSDADVHEWSVFPFPHRADLPHHACCRASLSGNLADFLHAILLAPFIYIMIPLGEK